MQLYAHDFSEFMNLDVGNDGLFHLGDTLSLCWSVPWRHAFWFRVDGQLAGFAILDERSRLTGDPNTMDVAEFFVMRKYRRRGIGALCAVHAFNLFPRKWEVRQQARNTAASAFWRKTIDRYTGSRFQETVHDDERWHGLVQSFDAQAVTEPRHA